MKACKWMGAVAAATLLLTSCLGEGDNSFSGSGFGVAGISETNYQPILYTAVGPMYSSATAALTPGTCWLVSYSVDLNSPENTSTSTSGAYYATISQMQEQLLSKPMLSPHLFFSVLLYARCEPAVSCPAEIGALENKKGT